MRSKKIFAASVAAIMAATSVYVVAAAEEQPEESGAAVDITTIKGGRKTATATKENQTVEVSGLHYVESFSVVLEGLDAGLTVTENETPANGEIKLTNCTYNSGTGKLTISVTEDNIKSGSAAAAYAIYESDSVKAATVTVNITTVVQTPNMEVSAVTFAGEDLAKDENDVYTAASDVSSSRDLMITVSGSHLVPQSALTGTADKAGYVVICDEADSVSGGGLNSTITFKNKTLTTEAETVNVYVTPFITNNSGEKETISEHKQTITVKVARETADDEEEKTATVTLGDVVVKVGDTVITKNSDGKYAVPAGTERVSIEAEVTVKNCTVVANDSVDVTRNNVIFAFCEYNDGKLFETLNLEDAAGTITFRYSIANGEYYPVAADLVTIEVVKDTSGTTSGDESSDTSTDTSSDTSSETTSSTTTTPQAATRP